MSKKLISIIKDEFSIAIETIDETSVEVSTIQNAFKCGEIVGLRYEKKGTKKK